MMLPKLKSWEVKQGVAVAHAAQKADEFGLPQTVYRTEDTSGWANTNPLSTILRNADVFVTMLPRRFFD